MGLGVGVAVPLLDYYRVLGVPRTASQVQIVCAFRELARQTHPDLNPNEPPSGKRFIIVYTAYEVLKNPEARAAYDSRLASLASSNGAAGVRPQQQTRTNGWEARAGARAWDATSAGTRRNNEWRRVNESIEAHDGTTISVVTRDGGNLTLGSGRGKEVKYNGLQCGIYTNCSEIKIDNVVGELTVPEGLDVILQLEIGLGNLVGHVVHGGYIRTKETRVKLDGASIGVSLDLNAVNLHVTGYRPGVRELVNQGHRTFTPPNSPHPLRTLNIESEMGSVRLRYNRER